MKSIRQSLAVFGCIAAFTGILSLVIFGAPSFTVDAQHNLEPTSAAAVYIGSGGCLTCHSDDEGNWSNDPQRKVLQHSASNPHAVSVAAEVFAPTNAPDNLSRPLQIDADESEQDTQKYMILTDAGYFLLPDDWTVADHPVVDGENASLSPNGCGDCHRFRRATVSEKAIISLTRYSG